VSRNRQRRKERRVAANEQERREAGAVAPESSVEDPGDTDERQRGEREDRQVEAAELIEALDVLRGSRANPLTAGITVFTAMLEQARAGYAADRLAELETALSLDFNALEAQGIVQIAMASMDETGVPDVERGVQLCIEARVEVAEDHGDGEESQVDVATQTDDSREEQERLEGEGGGDESEEARMAAEEKDSDRPGPED